LTTLNEESEVVEEAPDRSPKLTIVVILSTLLGILLTVIVAGAFLHFQSSKALQAEVLGAKTRLRKRALHLTI
jgi:flagellar basal body-associated protein FliL